MGLTVVPGNMIQDGTVTDSNFTNTTITSADMALDPRDADNFSSGSVPAAQLGNVPAADLTGLDDDLALLGFKTAANGSLAKYNLLDQTVDAFEDTSGVDALASTNATRDSSGKYYSGSDPATGGTITTDGGYSIHTFTADGTFVAGATANADILLVAGGGGGASDGGFEGGGGGGGYLEGTAISVSAASYSIVIGAGGAERTTSATGVGGNTTGFGATALGGGGGGVEHSTVPAHYNGEAGGSGGGGGGYINTTGGAGNQGDSGGLTGYGNNGGTGNQRNTPAAEDGGGGGGAGAVGGNSSWGQGGNGGNGKASSISGSSVTYAGGGGGNSRYGPNGSGGTGGGGDGSRSGPAGDGVDGLGGGGGAAREGGSGVAVIRFTTGAFDANNNMTLVSTATTAQAVPTKGDMVMTYTNGAGTAVINTNIKGYVSRDGGTTYTQGTLVSQGTTGGHTIASFHDLDISGQPSGSSMRYKIETLVQSAALATRIQAVSLGWS